MLSPFYLKFGEQNAANKYKAVIFDDVGEDLHSFKTFGKIMTCSPKWTSHPRSNSILWVKTIDMLELLRYLFELVKKWTNLLVTQSSPLSILIEIYFTSEEFLFCFGF